MGKEDIDAILCYQSKQRTGTNKEKGHGLGMMIVMELLQKINAHLHIESEKDKGITMSIRIPQ